MSAVTVITVAIRDRQRGDASTGARDYLLVFFATFLASLSVYAVFFVLFRYGGGLIATAKTTASPIFRRGPSAIYELLYEREGLDGNLDGNLNGNLGEDYRLGSP